MKANHEKKNVTLGEFIVAAYDAWGKRRGRGAVRLAIKTHLVEVTDGDGARQAR
ncbi:MAG TPA: hypothetical protein VHB20_04875 [Verrucomicrobiae bacterium]|jgi:hypothetical protein|nr:hypothetical protein [Verrucomicrobiae bacterium]